MMEGYLSPRPVQSMSRVSGRTHVRPHKASHSAITLTTHAATRPLATVPKLAELRDLKDLDIEQPEVLDMETRDVKAVSYVSRRRMDDSDFDADEVDEEGLPLVYNEERIAQFWKVRPGEMTARWTKFAAVSTPWLTQLANALLQGKLEERQVALARAAVDNLEKLGPTFIKLGQIMSIRPDVLPPAVMAELSKLQDRLEPFDTSEARALVEKELGRPLDEVFSEFSDEPVAAASLAQVYRARLRETGEEVAVKVQRTGALATISKDLYVMRRAVGVYEQIVKRFTAQTTDYQQLLSTFAEGLYTELDFRNEALNSLRMKELLAASEFSSPNFVIPDPLLQYTTRRVLTMEWVTGVKLTTLQPEEVRELIKIGQEAFLTQLLEIGFFHGDPHPGNLLKVVEGPHEGKIALLDFGLVAEIPERDRAAMVSATIHLANRNWDALTDDFVELGFLPPTADRGVVIPVMERVLSPYLRGGGARAFNFQALSQDLLAATLEIPFSVPPYMTLLARSVATLEGIALVGDPGYQMVAQAYPFVVRKVLRNDSAGGALVLREILYDADGNVKPTRLSAMMNAALGYVADEVSGFVDFDAVPADGASLTEILRFLLSDEARELRPLLLAEVSKGADLFLRDRGRRALAAVPTLAPRLPFIGSLPTPPLPPGFVPGIGLVTPERFVDIFCPELDQEEEIYLHTLLELLSGILGTKPDDLSNLSPALVQQVILNPNSRIEELRTSMLAVAGDASSSAVVQEMVEDVVSQVAARLADRAQLPPEQLFPFLPMLRRSTGTSSASGTTRIQARAGSSSPTPSATRPRHVSRSVSGSHSPSHSSSSSQAVPMKSLGPQPRRRPHANGSFGSAKGNGASGAARAGNGAGSRKKKWEDEPMEVTVTVSPLS